MKAPKTRARPENECHHVDQDDEPGGHEGQHQTEAGGNEGQHQPEGGAPMRASTTRNQEEHGGN